jgi:LPS export ABC transporter protein LptC
VLLLGSLAALTYWLDAQVQPSAVRRDGSSRHDPICSSSTSAPSTTTRTASRAKSLTAAARAIISRRRDAELTKPHIRITQADKPPFEVTSERAKISGRPRARVFHRHVQATREGRGRRDDEGPRGRGPLTLSTEYLHVIPKLERPTPTSR